MLLYILGFAIIALLAIVLNDPMDPEELARFYAPKIMNWDRREIVAPPMITIGPPHVLTGTSRRYQKKILIDLIFSPGTRS